MPTLLDHCRGVVTINSTLGLQALLHGAPVICLGDSIYDMNGLTYQAGLKTFWMQSSSPDKQLFSAFRDTVIALTQLNGSFYSDAGMNLLVERSIQRLLGPEPGADQPAIPSPEIFAATDPQLHPEYPN